LVVPRPEEVGLVKPIADRLRASSDAETLINVSEWLTKSISYHDFRVFCFTLDLVILLSFSMALFHLYEHVFRDVFRLPGPADMVVAIALLPLSYLVFAVALYQFNTFVKLAAAFAAIVLVSRFAWSSSIVSQMLMYAGGLVGVLLVLLYTILIFTPTRGLAGSARFVLASCGGDMRVDKVLRYRAATCREYSKLALSLLANLYPNGRLLLFVTLLHVAAGAELEGRMYVIEPGLPLLPPETWLRMVGFSEADVYEVVRTQRGFGIKRIGRVIAKGSALINEWRTLLERVVEEVEEAVRAGRRRAVVGLGALAQHLALGDRVVAESLLRTAKAYLCLKALGSCVGYVDSATIVHTEEGPAVEVTLAAPGKV